MKHQTTILTLSILTLLGVTLYHQHQLLQQSTRIDTLEQTLMDTQQHLTNLEYTVTQNHAMSWENWMRIRTLFYDYYHIQLESDHEP